MWLANLRNRDISEDRIRTVSGVHRASVFQSCNEKKTGKIPNGIKCAAVTHRGDLDDVFHPGINMLYIMNRDNVNWSATLREVVADFASEVTDDMADAFCSNVDDPDEAMFDGRYKFFTTDFMGTIHELSDLSASLEATEIDNGCTIYLVPNMARMHDWSFVAQAVEWKQVEEWIVRIASTRVPLIVSDTQVDYDFGKRLGTVPIVWPGGMEVVNGYGDGHLIYVIRVIE